MSTHPDSTPPTAPAGKALPLPTAEPCLSCGTTGGYTSPRNVTPDRKRGLCDTCYGQHYRAGTYKAFALIPESFTGFPPGYTHEPTGWPIVPACRLPLETTPDRPDRWGAGEGDFEAAWFVPHGRTVVLSASETAIGKPAPWIAAPTTITPMLAGRSRRQAA